MDALVTEDAAMPVVDRPIDDGDDGGGRMARPRSARLGVRCTLRALVSGEGPRITSVP